MCIYFFLLIFTLAGPVWPSPVPVIFMLWLLKTENCIYFHQKEGFMPHCVFSISKSLKFTKLFINIVYRGDSLPDIWLTSRRGESFSSLHPQPAGSRRLKPGQNQPGQRKSRGRIFIKLASVSFSLTGFSANTGGLFLQSFSLILLADW